MTPPFDQIPDRAEVLVFDSGVGGLSIVRHLRDRLPNITLTYLADSHCFPYGMMRDKELVERVVTLLTDVARQCRPDIIVVACNSASTLALPALRSTLTIPIVGVVPAIKPAARLSTTKVIGLLATPGTIRRPYTDTLIEEFAPDCEVIRVGSSELVRMAEQSLYGTPPSPTLIKEVMAPFQQPTRSNGTARPQVDTIVLACTHFPLLQESLAAAAPGVRHWVDSGEAIARRVFQLMQQDPKASTGTTENTVGDRALLTGPVPDNTYFKRMLTEFGFRAVASLND